MIASGRFANITLIASLLAALAGCASTSRTVDADTLTREAQAFMSAYEKELAAGDRAALPQRYDPRGSYTVFNGRKSFATREATAESYRTTWRAPAAFEWTDLSYDVISHDVVIVIGGFFWTPPNQTRKTFSYTALLVRDPQSGTLRLRLENESEVVARTATP